MKKTIYTLILACILFIPNTFFAQTTYTAVEYGGNWENPGTWSPAGVPGPGDYVIVMSKLVYITGQHEIAGFTLDWGTSAGTIEFKGSGNPSLTVTGNSTWGAGIFNGGNGANGGDDVNNTLLFTETSVVTMTYNPDHNFHTLYEGTYLINRGTIIVQGAGGVGGRGLSTLHNEGLFEIQGDGFFGGESFSGATFINTGTLRKSGGTGISNFDFWWNFENQGGTIDVQSGSLTYSGGGSFNDGIYKVSENAILSLSSLTYIFSGTLSGSPEGVFSLNGSATISTDSANVTFDIQGTGFQFIYGTINGGGTLLIPEGALFVLPGTNYAGIRAGTTLLNQGTIKQAGTYAFGIQGNSIVENQSLWEITSDADLSGGTGSGGTFKNTGTLLKSGGSDITFIDAWWNFKNEGGTIEVQSGTIEYRGGIYNFNGGTYSVAEGATLTLTGGTCTVSGTLSGSPEGVFSLNGTATISTDSTNVTFDIQGTGFQFIYGTINGGGTLIIPEGALFVLPGTNYTGLRAGTTLLNQGTVKQAGTYAFGIQGNSFVENQSLWEITSDADLSGGTGSGGTFTNTGIFRKSGGVDITQIDAWWEFQNLSGGIIDIETGTIEFTRSDKFENAPEGMIKGVGTFKVPSNFTNNGITSPGESQGALNYTMNYLPSETASLKIELGGLEAGAEHDQLVVTGTAALNGSIDVSLANGYIPTKGDTYVVLTSTGATSNEFVNVTATPELFIRVLVNPNDVTIVVDSVGNISAVGEGHTVAGFELGQNYPNPFYSNTKIKFEIIDNAANQGQPVSLKVYDLSGKEVADLMNSALSPGTYEVNFDGSFLPGGIYFCKLMQGNFLSTKKMVLMK